MTTRDQRLRELRDRWKAECQDRDMNNVDERSTYSICYRGLAAILADPVEVSDEMVSVGAHAITMYHILNTPSDMNSHAVRHELARAVLTATLKEPGQ